MSNPVKVWREARKRYQYLGQTGKIVSLTKIQTPVAGFEAYLPYFAAVIRLPGGKQVTGQLVESIAEPRIGSQVVGVLRRLRQADKTGVIEYGVKWKIVFRI